MNNSDAPPLRIWAKRIDKESRAMLDRLARWGRLAGPIAVMPDIHAAGDVCVGTVLATRDCVLPAAVGEDLGCGMLCHAFDFDARQIARSELQRIVDKGMELIPTGRRTHREAQTFSEQLKHRVLSASALEHQKNWLGARHVGTLGGGNHFIELQCDTVGRLWLTVHSGSRGIGAAIAAHHAKAAAALDKERCTPLKVLQCGTPEESAFWNDFNWAVDFAANNRARLAERIIDVVQSELRVELRTIESFDVPHNDIRRELQADGTTLVIHRKGAMPAQKGMRGIIPGSMGTASYIVEGLGHPPSYASCSHGAGRILSRKEARRKFRVSDVERQMKHVVYPKHLTAELVEELPQAYKDIREVLDLQRDLVKPFLRLEPLAVIKGG